MLLVSPATTPVNKTMSIELAPMGASKAPEPEPEKPVVPTFKCKICMEGDLPATPEASVLFCTNARHRVCTDCAQGHIRARLSMGDGGSIKCPGVCSYRSSDPFGLIDAAFPADDASIAEERQSVLDKFMRFSLLKALSQMDGAVFCPQIGCDNAFIVEEGCTDVQCDHCGMAFCTDCKGATHPGQTCVEADQQRSNAHDELESSLRHIRKYSKPCPQCKTLVLKLGGCNSMVCTFCGLSFCWGCMKKYQGNSHNDCYNIMIEEEQRLAKELKQERLELKARRNRAYREACEARRVEVRAQRDAAKAAQGDDGLLEEVISLFG